MARIAGIAALVLAPWALAACKRPAAAPPSAATPVAESREGLLRLFQQECLEQRNRPWVHEEAKRKRDNCGGFLLSGTADESDCISNVDGEVAWPVKTGPGATIMVTLSWYRYTGRAEKPAGPPEGQLDCSIAVPERLGAALQAAASQVRISGGEISLTSQPTDMPGIAQEWTSVPGGAKRVVPQIVLTHYLSMAAFKASLQAREYHRFEDEALARHEKYAVLPWQLEYYAPVK
jgi:hypothetical protein